MLQLRGLLRQVETETASAVQRPHAGAQGPGQAYLDDWHF